MKQRIMVIDDSPTVLVWAEQTLEEAGYDVITRSKPIGTGAAILRASPALVLLDVKMPSLAGDEVVRSLRKGEQGQRVRVVLHSSLPLEELRVRAKACGADGYFQKTRDKADFLRQIERLLADTEPPEESSTPD